ncbi:hypothetical protein NQZ68_000806 [Dissostichus eleginoides]|nr:hypothetical protein NQZ68_000806 [Dissostichus eleginoides]
MFYKEFGNELSTLFSEPDELLPIGEHSRSGMSTSNSSAKQCEEPSPCVRLYLNSVKPEKRGPPAAAAGAWHPGSLRITKPSTELKRLTKGYRDTFTSSGFFLNQTLENRGAKSPG